MKYIKKINDSFFNLKYDINDYVNIENLTYPHAKIIDKNKVSESYKVGIFFNGEYNEEWVDERSIIGKMSPEEIENYKIKVAAYKYNL